jgi:hypothetical protein
MTHYTAPLVQLHTVHLSSSAQNVCVTNERPSDLMSRHNTKTVTKRTVTKHMCNHKRILRYKTYHPERIITYMASLMQQNSTNLWVICCV